MRVEFVLFLRLTLRDTKLTPQSRSVLRDATRGGERNPSIDLPAVLKKLLMKGPLNEKGCVKWKI